MSIVLNGKRVEIGKPEMNLLELLRLEGLTARGKVLELNGKIYSNQSFYSIIVKDEDVLELIQFMGGG